MKNTFAVISSLCAMLVLILASSDVINCCRSALLLCAELIVPSLFPFFVLSILLSRLGFPVLLSKYLSGAAEKLFHVSGAGASAFFVGICGGYPMGAAYVADMVQSGSIGTDEGERLLAFCNNSGPAFIIGAMGSGAFHSTGAGVFLFAVHIISALICAFFLSRGTNHGALPEEPASTPFSAAFPEAVRQAVSSILNVSGFVICFSVFIGLLDANGFIPAISGYISRITGAELHFSRALICGIFELGSASGAMRFLSISPLNLALAAAVLSWGGISGHFQTYAIISDTKLKGTLHFAGRLISAVAAFILAYLGSYLFFRI